MNNQSIIRYGGIAAILGIVLIFVAAVVPVLFAIGVLLTAVFYYALYKFTGSSALGLAAVGSAVVGAIGIFFTGLTPSISVNIFMVLGFMLPALLGGLAANGKEGFSRIPALIGIVGGALGVVNAIVNISGGGDWTNLSNPTLQLLSNVTYYPASLLVTIWLVWAGILLLRAKSASQVSPA
jgi:hypothetical protein